MNREEQIRQASIEYTLKNRPMCVCGDSFAEMADELNRNSSFEEGVKWADNNPLQDIVNLNDVWHDASEEPQDRGKTLIISYTSIFDPVWLVFPNPLKIKDDWKRLVSRNKINKWAYVSDLIPKEEFESSYEKIG